MTRAAFDDEGYFKTGDFAQLRDGEYIFSGRANTDCTLPPLSLLFYTIFRPLPCCLIPSTD